MMIWLSVGLIALVVGYLIYDGIQKNRALSAREELLEKLRHISTEDITAFQIKERDPSTAKPTYAFDKPDMVSVSGVTIFPHC